MSVIAGHAYPQAILIGNFGGRPVYAVIADGTTTTSTTTTAGPTSTTTTTTTT